MGLNNTNSTNYNGWFTERATRINVIRVDGSSYIPGPDNAQSGTQYLDLHNFSTNLYKSFTLTTATRVNASAWLSNRDSQAAAYPSSGWSSRIEITSDVNGSTTIYASGNTVTFTKAEGNEAWKQTSLSNVWLPAGTYRIRVFLHDFGHIDTISYCFSKDTDADGIPDYLDTDSDNDGCPDVIEGGANFVQGASYITNNALNTVVNASGIPAVPAGTTGYDQTAGQTVGQSAIANPVAVAGTASNNQTICTGSIPSPLSLSGVTGSIQWQSSINNSNFSDIAGANSSTYTPPALAETMYYRAIVTSPGGCYEVSDVVTISVVKCTDFDGDGILDNDDLDDDNDGILDTDEITYCEQSPIPNGTVNGTGVNKGKLLFFNWGTASTKMTEGTTATSTYNGVTYTARISDITVNNSFTGTSPSDGIYPNDASVNTNYFGTLYNVTGAFNEAIWTGGGNLVGKTTFKINITATRGGIPVNYPLNVIAFDNEKTDAGENIIITSNGNPWTSFENRVGGVAAISGNRLTYSGNFQNIYASTNTSSILVEINSGLSGPPGGRQSMGIALLLNCDADNDGFPNIYDLDSDADGCFDAIEGDENVMESQLNANGSINISLVSPNNGVGNVSGVNLGVPNLVNAGGSADIGSDVGQGLGSSQNRLVNACICYNPVVNTATGTPVKHGISLLRSGQVGSGNWPTTRQSGHTVLESNTKGLVITRMTTTQINAISTPVEGMMVYDTNAKCLKIYSDSSWNCFSTPTCP